MRFTLAATALLLAPLFSSTAALNSDAAHLYLHPSSPSSTPAPLSAAQADRILSYHLRVPGARMGVDQQADPKAWEWAKGQAITTAEELFGEGADQEAKESVKRIVVVIDEAHRDLIPATLRHTHTIASAPHRNSFDALLHSYTEKLGGLAGLVAGAVSDAADQASEWIAGENRVKPESASENLNTALSTIGAFVRGGRFSEAHTPALSVVRFDEALADLKAAYEDTEFYPQALTTLTAALADAARIVEERGDSLAVLVLPKDKEIKAGESFLSRRDALAPFTQRQTDELNAAKQEAESKAPIEADYQGKCFGDAKALEKATRECSGRGKAVESRVGGRKCFVCKCESQKTKGKTTHFAGAACQKVDVSGPFVLIATTVLVLLLVTAGTVYHLQSEGNKELSNVLSGLTKSN